MDQQTKMKYELIKKRGKISRKLREDHIEMLYNIYKVCGISMWRSDTNLLPDKPNRRRYFIEKMQWPFVFIESCKLPIEEYIKLKPNEKQMIQYRITPDGINVLIELGYNIKDEHIAFVAREILRK